MSLDKMLNTDKWSIAATPQISRAMQYELPPHAFMQHDMSATVNFNHGNLYNPTNTRIKQEFPVDENDSPHGSDPNSRYSSNAPSVIQAYSQALSAISGPPTLAYPSPIQNSQHHQQISMLPLSYDPTQTDRYTAQIPLVQQLQDEQDPGSEGRSSMGSNGQAEKPFACSTCVKYFARRSDLARHERIHSGNRPHVCQKEGCGKSFIQKSALNVHERVHTGEKPHKCERCGKPFGDSSSLARHRRIHSGKRPYKCAFPECHKTFTRRTTLTRHQNHHTGSLDEAIAASSIITGRESDLGSRDLNSEGDEHTDYHSLPTPSTLDRPSSVSPAVMHGPIPNLTRTATDYYLNAMNGPMASAGITNGALMNGTLTHGGMNGNAMGVPPHLRTELSNHSPRPGSPANSPQVYMSMNGSRNTSLTSLQNSYSMPNSLEPPTANGSSNNSLNNSPSLAPNGWQSPSHAALAAAQQRQDYTYPDAHTQQYVQNAQNLYYNTAMQPQRISQDLWAPQH